ncbi:hypothetical protein, partial [Acinetobacter baumannii]|uniref:hypothetical protein n=1 Tax=Acinetobacter baumannii TaxID=470 RepID=UPI001B375872
TEARNALLTVFVNDGETTGQQLLPFGSYFSGASQEYNAAIETVIQKWRAGQTDAKGLLKEIDAVNQQFDDGSAANKRYGEQLIDAAKKIVEIDGALEEAGLVVKAFSKDTDEAGDALDQLAGKADQAGSAVN